MKRHTLTMRYLAVAFIAALLTWCWSASPAHAQQRIQQIKVEGTQRIEPATVMSYVDLQVGDDFNPDRLDNALKSLFSTGLFADVTFYQEGQALVIAVVENPIINQIAFEGNKKIKDADLLNETQLRPRNVLTRTKVQADVERLQEIFRIAGHVSAYIQPKIIKRDQNRVDLVFEISEGPQTLISRVSFIGNKHFNDSKLQKVIRSKEERWWRFWSGDDKYDPDRLAYDRELLRKFYLNHGYADFRVDSAVGELSPDRKNFYVTFTMDEGIRYKVGKILIRSEVPGLNADAYREHLSFEAGEWYKASAVEKSIADITDAVESHQYSFVDVRPSVERRRDKGLIDVTFSLVEGQQVFVENINIQGNVRTLDEVIRRQMKLAEGDPFNISKLKKSEENLQNLAYFETATAKTVPGSAPDKTNIDVTVAEKSTGELSVAGGFSTQDGPLGNFSIKERNFLGKGQIVSLSTTLASRRTEFDFSFTEPYFRNRDLAAGFDLFHITQDFQNQSSFDTKRTGGSLRIGYPLGDNWRQTLGYYFARNEINHVPATASVYVQRQVGTRTISSLTQRITYDSTDSPLEPTEGLIARFDGETAGLGGNARYVKVKLGGTYYYPILDNWIFSVLGEAGKIAMWGGDRARINERFNLGGPSLRGFSISGIGPRDIATNDSLGGKHFYRGSAEIDFPSGLPEDLGIRFHTFVDAGSVGNPGFEAPTVVDKGSLRLSSGVGLSWKSPMGPVRVDLGQAIIKENYDETEMFQVNFGTRF